MLISESLRIYKFLSYIKKVGAHLDYGFAEIAPFKAKKGIRKNFNLRTNNSESPYHNILILDILKYHPVERFEPEFIKLEFGISGANIITTGTPGVSILNHKFRLVPSSCSVLKILEITPTTLTIIDQPPIFIGMDVYDRDSKVGIEQNRTNSSEELPF